MVFGVQEVLLVGQDVVRGLVELDEPALALVVDGRRDVHNQSSPVDQPLDLVPGAAEQRAQVDRRLADERFVEHVLF